MVSVTKKAEDAQLAEDLADFLSSYRDDPQKLPRESRELFDAQRLLRRVLLATRDYSIVYEWYMAFKNPHGVDQEVQMKLFWPHVTEAATALAWVKDYDCVLECGSGASSLGLELAKHNHRWIASDIAHHPSLDRAVEEFSPGPNFEFIISDGTNLQEIPDGEVDLVISRSFFEHLLVDDAESHVRSAFRVLRPGGQLFVACPSSIGPPSDITQRFPEYDTPQGLHIKEYNLGELSEVVRAAGFTSIHNRFVRSRYTSLLPLRMQRLNFLPERASRVVEIGAEKTWPLARFHPRRRRAWRRFWAVLGAASVSLLAKKPG